MKPFGKNGKLEMAKCGCCAKHPNQDEMLPCRNTRIKRVYRKREKHYARQVAKVQIAIEMESPQ